MTGLDSAVAEELIDTRIDRDDPIEDAGVGIGIELNEDLQFLRFREFLEDAGLRGR